MNGRNTGSVQNDLNYLIFNEITDFYSKCLIEYLDQYWKGDSRISLLVYNLLQKLTQYSLIFNNCCEAVIDIKTRIELIEEIKREFANAILACKKYYAPEYKDRSIFIKFFGFKSVSITTILLEFERKAVPALNLLIQSLNNTPQRQEIAVDEKEENSIPISRDNRDAIIDVVNKERKELEILNSEPEKFQVERKKLTKEIENKAEIIESQKINLVNNGKKILAQGKLITKLQNENLQLSSGRSTTPGNGVIHHQLSQPSVSREALIAESRPIPSTR